MEFTIGEVQAIETTTIEAANQQVHELEESQLALVGGGNVIITLG